eukprot:747780-Hanusia_phi.AAC.1
MWLLAGYKLICCTCVRIHNGRKGVVPVDITLTEGVVPSPVDRAVVNPRPGPHSRRGPGAVSTYQGERRGGMSMRARHVTGR